MIGPFIEVLRDHAAEGATLLLASLWQGMLVVAAVALLLRAAPRLTASQQAKIWTTAFFACALLPVGNLLFAPPDGPAQALTTHRETLVLASSWSIAVVLLSVFCSFLGATRLGSAVRYLLRLKRSARALPGHSLPSETSPRKIEILATAELHTPVAAGFLHPAILLPEALLRSLSSDELEQVLRHERAHLDRRDDWTVLALRATRCLLPLNPALFFIERQLSRLRELACDDAVLAATPRPQGYAACLTHLAEYALQEQQSLVAPRLLGRRSQLHERVLHILAFHPERVRPSWKQPAFAAAGMLLVLLLAGGLCEAPDLVAFAPSSATTMAATSIPQEPTLLPGAHMVEAKAVLPRTAAPSSSPLRANMKKSHAQRLRLANLPAQHRPHPPLEQLVVARQAATTQTMPVLVLWTAPGEQPQYSILLLVAHPAHSLRQQLSEELFTES